MTRGGTLACALFILCVVADFFLARSLMPNSDSVQSFNQLFSLRQGNILLHGWAVNSDNFYFTDCALFAMLGAVFGIRLWLLYFEPVLVITLLLVSCTLLIHRCGGARRNLRFVVLLYLIGIPFSPDLYIFLLPDYHICTIAFCLSALLAIEPVLSRQVPGKGAAVIFFILSFAAAASDPMADVFFLSPLILFITACAAARREFSAPGRLVLLLALIALFSAMAFPKLIAGAGGFSTHAGYAGAIVTPGEFLLNAKAVVSALQVLFAGDLSGHSGLLAQAFAATRIGAGAMVFLLCARIVMFGGRGKHPVAVFLVVCAACLLTADVLSSTFARAISEVPDFPGGALRYVTPAFIFLALAASIEAAACFQTVALPTLLALLGAVFALIFAIAAARAVQNVARQPAGIAIAPQRELAAWLANHDLTYGVGDYWTAPMVTAMSLHRVVMDPVWVHGGIQPYPWLTDTAHMNAHEPPQFVAFSRINVGAITLGLVEQAYGKPAEVIIHGAYIIFLPKTHP